MDPLFSYIKSYDLHAELAKPLDIKSYRTIDTLNLKCLKNVASWLNKKAFAFFIYKYFLVVIYYLLFLILFLIF